MLSDAEFREFLDALARKHLMLSRLDRLNMRGHGNAEHTLGQIMKIRRLLSVISQDMDDDELLLIFAKRLEESYIDAAIDEMDRSGVLDAIEEDPTTLFGNLRRSAIPKEDIEMLRQAGVDDPEAEILLIINFCKNYASRDRLSRGLKSSSPVAIAQHAESALQRVAIQLGRDKDSSGEVENINGKKKRKLLNGSGKILSGGVLGVGNILLGSGVIPAPNAGTAHAVIASCAIAIGAIMQGVGDIFGE